MENKDLVTGIHKLSIEDLNKLVKLVEDPGFIVLCRLFDETFERLRDEAFFGISQTDQAALLRHGNRHGQYETMETVRNIGVSAQDQIKIREEKAKKGILTK